MAELEEATTEQLSFPSILAQEATPDQLTFPSLPSAEATTDPLCFPSLPVHPTSPTSFLCPNDCGQKISRSRQSDHNSVCSHARVRCSAASAGCPFRGQRFKISDHEKTCAYVPLKPMLDSFSSQVRAAETDFATKMHATHENYVVRVLAMERTVRQLSFHLMSGKRPILVKEHSHPLSEFGSPSELSSSYGGKFTCSLCGNVFHDSKVLHCEMCNGSFDLCPACLHPREPLGMQASPSDQRVVLPTP